jgi:hypothetical protein
MVSGKCPKCGKEISASSLEEFKKLVKKCCAGPQIPWGPRVPYNHNIPPLPFEVVFERSVASQNKSTYSHWRVYYNDKTNWRKRVLLAFKDHIGIILPWSDWHLIRTYKHPSKEMDYANFIGGAKPLIDALIFHGIIYDDANKYFQCEYTQLKGDSNTTKLILRRIKNETAE